MRVQWSAQFASSSTKSGRDSLFIWLYFFFMTTQGSSWGTGKGWLVNLYNNHKSGRTWPLRKCCDLFVFVECSLQFFFYLSANWFDWRKEQVKEGRSGMYSRGWGVCASAPLLCSLGDCLLRTWRIKLKHSQCTTCSCCCGPFYESSFAFLWPAHTQTTGTHTHTRTHIKSKIMEKSAGEGGAIKSGNCCN